MNEPYLAAVRELPCYACGVEGPSDPHHAATWKRGLGQKCDDSAVIALCRTCHDELHGLSGRFAGWTKERRREWAALAIEHTLLLVAAHALADVRR